MYELVIVIAVILIGIGYSKYRKRCLLKKKVQKFEESLVDLKITVEEAISSCKKSLPPPEQLENIK